ncbi:MAG: Rieske 2Fe-2S domain-containing protein [Crocosphaera sp.]|nr:Rieske 2Fe-2S domain-containing protein [Crocosphaera sp.]
MTLASNEPTTEQVKATSLLSEIENQFNWKECWYPVTFVKDLPKDRPYGFSLYDKPLVLFRNKEETLICLKDICPHRAAKLSDGEIIDGKIECSYHGWQFGEGGQCLHIPQLPEETKIPETACVQSYPVAEVQGMVWIWAGTPEKADKNNIPTVADLDDPKVFSSDVVMDLPYDQNFFIENVIDPAHLFISHNGSWNMKELAQPLEMEILNLSVKGIEARYCLANTPHKHWMSLNFIAPNLVIYRNKTPQRIGGAALYSLPSGKGCCRIVIRNYTNSPSWKLKLQPRWFEHWSRTKFIEEDLSLVVGQELQTKRLQKSLKELYLPLKTSDIFVVEYRKWLDKYGSSFPSYQGYETAHNIDGQLVEIGTRLTRHTEICGACNQAYENTKKIKRILITVAIILAAIALILDHSSAKYFLVAASLFSVALVVVVEQVKIKFERSYTRH